MRVGEVFVKRSQDEVVAEAEARLERVKKEMESDSREKAAIEAQLASLKAALYSKFGNNINLETK